MARIFIVNQIYKRKIDYGQDFIFNQIYKSIFDSVVIDAELSKKMLKPLNVRTNFQTGLYISIRPICIKNIYISSQSC